MVRCLYADGSFCLYFCVHSVFVDAPISACKVLICSCVPPGLWILFIWGLLFHLLVFWLSSQVWWFSVVGSSSKFIVYVACLWTLPLSTVMHVTGTNEFHAKFSFFKILSIYSQETQRETETQAEEQAGSLQGAPCRTRSQDPRVTP